MTGKQFCLLKSSTKHPGGGGGLIYFKHTGGEGAYLKGGALCNLAKTMVSVLHKGLEYKVEKPRIINKSRLPVGE